MKIIKKSFLSSVLLLVALGMISSQALAARLLAVTTSGQASSLVELDDETGALINPIGPIGYNVQSIAYDATSNTLYGLTTDNAQLLSISISTGAATEIGTGKAGFGSSSVFFGHVSVLSVNSVGELYSVSALVGEFDFSDYSLFLWDKSTGTVSNLGFVGSGLSATASGFDASDSLYLISHRTAVLDVIAIHRADAGYNNADPAFSAAGSIDVGEDELRQGDFHPESNLYYAANVSGELRIVNMISRNVTSLASPASSINALTFIPEVAPELGECNEVSGIDIHDVICTINKVLGED